MPLEIKYGTGLNIKKLVINKVDKDFQEIIIKDPLEHSESKFLIDSDEAQKIITYLQQEFKLYPHQ